MKPECVNCRGLKRSESAQWAKECDKGESASPGKVEKRERKPARWATAATRIVVSCTLSPVRGLM